MNLLITGLPGAGKGTQSENIVKQYGVVHLSTGDLFRHEISNKTDLGLEAKSFIDNGQLVPDQLTIKMLEKELLQEKYSNGFLLDGFPRTIAQAEFLDKMLVENKINLDGVIALDLAEDIIIERLVNRLYCPKCSSTFHKIFVKPQVEGICDKCGTELIQREDDKLESIKKRLAVANEQTMPVVDYYREQNKVFDIKMAKEDTETQVFDKIVEVLK